MLKGSIIDRCCCYDNLVPSDTWRGALVEIGLAVNVLNKWQELVHCAGCRTILSLSYNFNLTLAKLVR